MHSLCVGVAEPRHDLDTVAPENLDADRLGPGELGSAGVDGLLPDRLGGPDGNVLVEVIDLAARHRPALVLEDRSGPERNGLRRSGLALVGAEQGLAAGREDDVIPYRGRPRLNRADDQ